MLFAQICYIVFYPNDIFQVLEFDRLLILAESYCKGEAGKRLLKNVRFHTNPDEIERLLSETMEFKLSLDAGDSFPTGNYTDIDTFLKYLKITDYFLEVEHINELRSVLEIMKTSTDSLPLPAIPKTIPYLLKNP
ncbi:MAG: hypothetical protein HWD63_09355 [Candidatus Parvibacillus calidus]|nr:MAG: hypothetical protein HWD63_09355 [Candidatus Parvibacillus calidus]